MYRTVLVPTDGSPGAQATIDTAIDVAEAYDGAVHALYVVETTVEPMGLDTAHAEELSRISEQHGREATITVADRAERRGLGATREVREGVPHRAIPTYAAEQGVDLIVMGTHGRTGVDRARLGSTTERVIALADVPVLSVGLVDETDDTTSSGADWNRILIPTDGSDAAERAAERGVRIAEYRDADVHVAYVIDTSTYALQDTPQSIIGLLTEGGRNAVESVAAMARERGCSVTTTVRRGHPAAELLAYASAIDADLLAMGTRGRSVESHPLLGSTTAQIVRRSPVPVLTSR